MELEMVGKRPSSSQKPLQRDEVRVSSFQVRHTCPATSRSLQDSIANTHTSSSASRIRLIKSCFPPLSPTVSSSQNALISFTQTIEGVVDDFFFFLFFPPSYFFLFFFFEQKNYC